jgi:hypothetical protein
MAATTKPSFYKLDNTKRCDTPFTFQFITEGASDDDDGVSVTVLGNDSPTVQNYLKAKADKARAREWMRRKKGEDEELSKIDELVDINLCNAAIRVTDWGFEEPCTFENVKLFCSISDEFLNRVLKESNKLSNFPVLKL